MITISLCKFCYFSISVFHAVMLFFCITHILFTSDSSGMTSDVLEAGGKQHGRK